MIEAWVEAVKSQSYGNLMFILGTGLAVTTAVLVFVFLATSKKEKRA